MDTGENGRIQTPVEVLRHGPKVPPRSAVTAPVPGVKAPTNAPPANQPVDEESGPTRWAEEEDAPRPARNSFGPLGLVAAAVLLMVAVYLGATLLMKH
jgi:hypothetical protein